MSSNLNKSYTFKRFSSEESKGLSKNFASAIESPSSSSDDENRKLDSVEILRDIKSKGCTFIKSKSIKLE
jgi:hypothetical protein